MGWYYVYILIIASFGTSSFGYPTPYDVDGSLHRWPITSDAPTVYYDVISTDSSLKSYLEPIVDSATNLWSNIDNAKIKLKSSTSTNPSQITVNYNSSIQGGDMAAGYSIFDEVSNGTPVHCSVHITANDSSNYEALEKTTLHELGHCLGLGHSLIANSIMSYALDKNSFALSLDDQAAISRLYPLDGSKPKLPTGCAISLAPSDDLKPGIFLVILNFPIIFGLVSSRPKRPKRN
jgi:Matrixin